MTIDWTGKLAARAAALKPSDIRELAKLASRPGMISFAAGAPDPALFPQDAIVAAATRIFADPARRRESLQYGASEGYAPLRAAIVDYLARKQIVCDAAEVLVTTGSQQALEFLGKLLLEPGDRVVVVRPTYLGAIQAFGLFQPVFVPVSQSAAGLDLIELEAALAAGAKFIYLVPDYSNPTGLCLPLQNRRELLALSRCYGVPIVEDQAYGELAYEGEAPAALRALDCEQVLYVGTFSKSLVPGLRVGWIVAPAPVLARLVMLKQASDLHGPMLSQMLVSDVACELSGAHIENLRRAYRSRRDAMLDALRRFMPDHVSWMRPDGGMFVWLTLPASVDAAELLARAVRDHEVIFVPGGSFHTDGSGGNTARLSFSLAAEDRIEEGVRRLAQAIHQHLSDPAETVR